MNKLYDPELDTLFISNKRHTYASVQVGDLIIDFDRGYNVSSLEILNPDKYLKLPKKVLKNLKKAKISAQKSRGQLYIFIEMIFLIEGKEVKKSHSITMPIKA